MSGIGNMAAAAGERDSLCGSADDVGERVPVDEIGQICEITTQIRGEAGERQHSGAQTGLAHMVGVGAVCVVHVLGKGERAAASRRPATTLTTS